MLRFRRMLSALIFNRKCGCLALVVCFTIVLLFYRKSREFYPGYPAILQDQPVSHYLQIFPQNVTRNKKEIKILFWTPYFGGWGYFQETLPKTLSCKFRCVLTNTKSEINNSDAVMFHEVDFWEIRGWKSLVHQSLKPMPNYRRPNQVWILHSQEPLMYSWGSLKNFPSHLAFNWTSFCRQDSTIPNPYGKVIPLSKEEILTEKQKPDFNYASGKTKLVAALISNSIDDVKRYRIIRELQKHIKVDTYGDSYKKPVCKPATEECLKKEIGIYTFYLALENSFCQDYITEKLWNALKQDQIPITAYPFNVTGIVLHGSYLNLFDFPSIKHLAERILEIDRNETLYNSFFQWKKVYRFDTEPLICKICEKLHTDVSAQVYTDIEGWMTHDTCQRSGLKLVSKNLDRLLFDLGLT